MSKYLRFGFGMLGVLLLLSGNLGAQAPASADSADTTPDSAGLEELVGRIALYPDDLLSIILPAATFPLQIVEANRWIQKNKDNADAQPKDSWDDAVKALLNYPEVINMMSDDLDWTASLGEAVVADQTAVMDAAQSFRRKAEGAGNLVSDDKQTVVVEEQVVKIVQADPQVIYVPQYEPTVVVVQQPAPVYPTYYPNPYPVYYYPYPPGHAFASAFFWGAATAYAFNWFHGSIHGGIDIDIDIDRDVNRNSDRDVNRNSDRDRNVDSRSTNIDRAQSEKMASENRGSWQSKQSPTDVRQGRTSPSTAQSDRSGQRSPNSASRPTTANAGGASRASASQSGRSNQNVSKSNLNYQNASRNSSAARSTQPSKSAYSGMTSGRTASAQSARGSSSRSASRGGGGRRR